MSKSLLAACLMATALTTAPAFAQAPAAGQFMKEQTPNEWRGSKLVGLNVYGKDNQKIGDISDILLDRNGEAKAVVIGVGGFLGIGQKDVAVPFKSLQFSDQPAPSSSASSSSGNASSSASSSATGSASSSAGAGAGSSAGGVTNPSSTASTNTSTTGSRDSTATRGYPDHAMLSMTKDELNNAPEFHYVGSTARGGSANRPATGTGTGPATGAGTGTAPRQ